MGRDEEVIRETWEPELCLTVYERWTDTIHEVWIEKGEGGMEYLLRERNVLGKCPFVKLKPTPPWYPPE